MSGASERDDCPKMDRILKASTSGEDDSRKLMSVLKSMPSASGGDDGSNMPDGRGSSSSMEEADKGGNRKMRKGRGSSSVEETDKGAEISLKKGPWTQEEDAILIEYVGKHGLGNWNAVQKNSGLARCGKSCRLRWANHLRPNLKKGAFTAEEEQRIIELHASMGNKWSKMAAELPGRTDNEIKNFWNTRVKRRQRAGQTTYPDEVEIYRQQVPNGNQESLNPNAALTNEARQHHRISQTENLDIPNVEFSRLELPPCTYDPSICMPMTPSDILAQQHNMLPMMHPSVSDMLANLQPSTYSALYNMLPTIHPSKRLRGSDMLYNSLDPSAVPRFDQYGTSDPRLLCPCDAIFNTNDQFGSDLIGSNADSNGNNSASSDPIYGAFKVELPSIQYFESRRRIWNTHESSLPPLVGSVDTPESSIQFQPNQSVPVSHQNNDGLLESVIYDSKNLNGSNNVNSFQENNDHCLLNEAVQNSFQENNDDCVLNEEVQNSTLNPSETQETLRSSLGSFDCSMETTEDHGDEHGALTEFPANSPSQYNQDPLHYLLDPEPAPDLSFIYFDRKS